jgi:two-component system, oxyanion-binding sensor
VTEVGAPGDAKAIGLKLSAVAKAMPRKLRFGVVHRYSSHNYMLRYWLRGSGLDPNTDVDIVTVSPPFVADALESGEIDGICVGEPWNSVAVHRGVGVIAVVTSQIWLRGVEKVLAMQSARMESETDITHRLIRALYRAGEVFVDPRRLDGIANVLARPEYLDGSSALIKGAISDNIVFACRADPIHIPDFMFQHREAANFPWTSQAAWLYAQMVEAGHVDYDAGDYSRAQQVFRPDVYRAALRPLGVALPGASAKLEGGIEDPLGVGTTHGRLILGPDRFFDGASFDPESYA